MLEHLSWNSVFNPAATETFFPLRGLPLFPIEPGFDYQTAWFLSECSRLAYLCDDRKRRQILTEIGWEEVCWCTPNDLAAGLWRKNDVSILVFRGTNQAKNWLRNLDAKPQNWLNYGQVHSGFLKSLELCWEQLHAHLSPNQRIWCTGHSLGGAIASLAALQAHAQGVYNFGSPRVGDETFSTQFTQIEHYRCCTIDDMVTHLPPSKKPFRFQHIGEAIWLGEKGRKRDRFKARLKQPEILFETPKHLSDHAPINYSKRLAELCP